MAQLRLPAPDAEERRALDDPARFKLFNWGRRRGKTLTALVAGIVGHGPDRRLRGLLAGVPVLWLTPDYPQSREVWRVYIRPRFAALPGFVLSESERRVDAPNGGSLEIRSAEAIDGVRGRKLGAAIIDEGGWLDLEYCWVDVLRPALTDLEGWALFISTPNAGQDGNQAKLAPSFFNRLCTKAKGGELNAEWLYHHQRTRDNPSLKPAEVDALYKELGVTTPQAKQELDAELLLGGIGVAFPEWDRSLHVQDLEPNTDDPCAAGCDWGHGTPGWFGLVYTLADGRLLLRHELYFKGLRAKKVGYLIGKLCLQAGGRVPDYLALDASCFNTTGTGATIADKMQEGLDLAYARASSDGDQVDPPAFLPAPKGPDAVRTQTALLREVLGWEKDKDGVLVERPQLVVHSECREFVRTITTLPLDPLHPNRFDTKGEDHPAQGLAYLLVARAPEAGPNTTAGRDVAEARARLDAPSRREADGFDRLVERVLRRQRLGG